MSKQATLDGGTTTDPLVFDCPMCGKHFELEQTAKYIKHRPWAFHIAYEHGQWLVDNAKSTIGFWLQFYNFYDDPELVSWLLNETGISKQEERT